MLKRHAQLTTECSKKTGADFSLGGYKAWSICLSAGLFFFFEFIQLNAFDVLNEVLRADFALNATQLSVMSSTFFIGNILFLIPAGILLDRFSVRWVIFFAMLISTIGTFGFALSHTYLQAAFFHFLTGIANAFAFLACVVLVSRWFLHKRQAFMVGTIVTMAFLGGVVAHTPWAYLYQHVGWRHAFLWDGGLGLLITLWLGYWIQDSPKDTVHIEKTATIPFHKTVMSVLSNPQNWLSGIYISTMNLPIMVLGALWGGSYLTTVQHISAISASEVVSFLYIGSMFGCPMLGALSDAMRRRKLPMALGALVSLCLFIPFFLHTTLGEPVLYGLFFLIGFFTSAQVIGYPCIAESNRSENTAFATSIASILIMGGGGAGQVLFGHLMQYHAIAGQQTYDLAQYQFAFCLFPTVICIAMIALLFLRESFAGLSLKRSNKEGVWS